jgi:hypothetical protein
MPPSFMATRPASGWLGDAPNYSFHGKGRRADIVYGLSGQRPTCMDDPGPGTYEPPMSIGPQIDSRKHSSQRTRVGTANRDVRFKQYVSKEHEGDLFGKHSPAPNKYNPSIRPVSETSLEGLLSLKGINHSLQESTDILELSCAMIKRLHAMMCHD